jgi:NADP-dependent 3-hydroxy acid dehydrogenase YdfG
MISIARKTVLITGGSQGYGKAIADNLVKAGFKVIIAARSEELLKQVKEEIKCEDYIVMDVTSALDWEKTFIYIKNKYGRLDVLINNAGGAISVNETINQSIKDIDQIIGLNLNSVIYGSRIFGSLMKEQRSGTIINIASVCAKHAWPGWSVYGAAKAGVLEFSKGLYTELQPYNIKVTCVIPGAGATDFMQHAGGTNKKMRLQPEDIGKAIVYLCKLPEHVVIEEMKIWGNDQVVIPL